ncbi:MAG TPA: hypothetical protein VKR57_07310 [Terriglobales bacterium]|jgi:hypothetical protein|nr:hypothetical protein [Terriglobales bacterium]
MENYNMDSTNFRSNKGFTLVATLLLLLLMSGIAIGMLMMVSTEAKVGTQDVQNNTTFAGAEGAIEKMTSDLAGTFQNIESPTVSQIEGLSALAPANTLAMSYPVYTLTPATTVNGAGVVVPQTSFGQIASGPYQGLSAELLPVTLTATAQGPLGDEVNMTRTVQVALIPVFQFGIYSQSDLSFFAGVNLDFNGRVHTNGDLYLAAGTGDTLTFHDKMTAYGNIIRWELPNGNTNANTAHLGTVDIPTAAQGCDGLQPACRAMAATEGSVTVGAAPATWTTGGQNGGWMTISTGTADYNSWIIDANQGLAGGTGAKQLSLPFVSGTANNSASPQPYEIVRKPPAGELNTSLLGAARLYNEASIRVMLVDDPAELPGGATDTNNIRLANYKDPDNGVDYSHGVVAGVPAAMPGLGAGNNYTTYFATASSGVADPTNWIQASSNPIAVDWLTGPLYPPPVVTLHDPSGLNQAPYMVRDGGGNAVTKAPGLANLDLCNPSTPVSVPPAAGPPVCDIAPTGYPYYSLAAYPTITLPYPTVPANTSTWNLLDGYLRVEYRDATGNYHPVTQEWLALGFARGLTPPLTAGSNPINPNAILILQEPADRNHDGVVDVNGAAPNYTTVCTKTSGGKCTQYTYTPYPGKPPEATTDSTTLSAWYGYSAQAAGSQSATQYNWYPINFYDAREGEARDVQTGDNSCAPVGIMNAVELDVGNLSQWLKGNTGTNGPNVDYASQNGYVLYFSDRRGMLPNPNGTQVDPKNTKTGDSGFEDVVNRGSANGTPDNKLETTDPGKTESSEDANNNTVLDNFGSPNLGLGMGYIPVPSSAAGTAYTAKNQVNNLINATAAPNFYLTTGRIPSCWIAQNNWVSGARHVLKLVDGTLGNLPVRPDLAFPNSGGFTVGSENPVYIFGNYNTNAGDPIWAGKPDVPHAAAAVIADAVTALSNSWSDWESLNSPSSDGPRNATTTYYRTAVASGKNINFSVQGLAWAVGDFGTDGGLHNFLRLLENWGGQTLNYNGSMVSMFYATYATGTDKNGGGTTYEPPARNYTFDADFTQPQQLPPGTPMFRDIDNLSYRQSFSACANVANGVCTN